jgi:hypothetical protein
MFFTRCAQWLGIIAAKTLFLLRPSAGLAGAVFLKARTVKESDSLDFFALKMPRKNRPHCNGGGNAQSKEKKFIYYHAFTSP